MTSRWILQMGCLNGWNNKDLLGKEKYWIVSWGFFCLCGGRKKKQKLKKRQKKTPPGGGDKKMK